MYLVSKASSPNYGTGLVQRVTGLGCACQDKSGLGLFDSGLDLKSWGPMEWIIAAVSGFAVLSMFSTTKRGVVRAQKSLRSSRARSRRKQELRRELEGL